MDYPLWLQIILALCMGLALAGLGAWLFCTSATKAIDAANKLEDRRTNRETEALDNWKTAYEAEHEDHINDVAELTGRILTLEREIKIKNQILSKVKVTDI